MKNSSMVLCALAVATVTVSSCGSSLSEHEKAVKAEVKELKKGGWKVLGDEDLTTLVSKHLEKKSLKDTLEGESYSEYLPAFGVQYGVADLDSGKELVRKDAASDVADFCAKLFKDVNDSTLFCDDPRFDTVLKEYKSIVVEKIAPELVPSFYTFRKSKDYYDVLGYFLYETEKIAEIDRSARMEAFVKAGFKVQDIKGGFKVLDDSSEQEAN